MEQMFVFQNQLSVTISFVQ